MKDKIEKLIELLETGLKEATDEYYSALTICGCENRIERMNYWHGKKTALEQALEHTKNLLTHPWDGIFTPIERKNITVL